MAQKTQVDYRRALVKIRKARKEASKQGELTVKDLLREGLYKAKAVAPWDTGLTAKSVRTIQTKKNNGSSGRIIAPNAHKAEFSRRANAGFNLTQWMHNPRNFGHFKRARPDFMNLTAEYLNKIKLTTAKQRFQKIQLKYGK